MTFHVRIDDESFRQADAFLARLPLEVRRRVLDAGLRAAGNVAAKEMRRQAPDSIKSGSRKKWSKRQKAKRSGAKQHKQTIGVSTVRDYPSGLTAIYVGPLHPAGNLINVLGHPHAEINWGRRTGRTLPATAYIKQAGEQTRGQQNAAFINTIRRKSDELLATAK